jgi:hypothetical protein
MNPVLCRPGTLQSPPSRRCAPPACVTNPSPRAAGACLQRAQLVEERGVGRAARLHPDDQLAAGEQRKQQRVARHLRTAGLSGASASADPADRSSVARLPTARPAALLRPHRLCLGSLARYLCAALPLAHSRGPCLGRAGRHAAICVISMRCGGAPAQYLLR